jgi:hypothetical protein
MLGNKQEVRPDRVCLGGGAQGPTLLEEDQRNAGIRHLDSRGVYCAAELQGAVSVDER